MPAEGCYGEAEWHVDGLEKAACPVMYVGEYAEVFRTYNFLQQGILPHSGGWADQPGILMALAAIVEDEKAKFDERRLKNGPK